MAVAQIAGMALVPAAAASSRLAALLGYVAHLGADGLVRSADFVRLAPIVAYRVAPPHWPAVALYYASGCVAWWSWRRLEVVGGGETVGARLLRRAAIPGALLAAIWIL